jgi:glucosamine 6-phosphate synthetase-like amidotransferase/phosphosugar isomerase protein
MTILDYIHEQPSCLARIWRRRSEIAGDFARLCYEVKPDRLHLVASGSSLNAARVAAPFMEEVMGVEATPVAPSMLRVLRGQRPLVVAISQEGRSTNVIRAVRGLSEVPVIALTSSESAPLAGICGGVIPLECGAECVGPKTKGYTSTIFTLCMAALAASRNGEIDMSAMPLIMEKNISLAEAWLDRNKEALSRMAKCALVGKLDGHLSMFEGALKMQETLRIPAVSHDFEEFLHGPSCAIDSDFAGLYVLPSESDEDALRVEKMAQMHSQSSDLVFTVGERSCLSGGRSLELDIGGDWCGGPFAWILPCQLIAARIPAMLGIQDEEMLRFREFDSELGIKEAARNAQSPWGNL